MRMVLLTVVLSLFDVALMLHQYAHGDHKAALVSAFAAGFCFAMAVAIVIFVVERARRRRA